MITKLTANDYHLVEGMFNLDFPNLAFIEAILMQNIIGEIWVNSDTKIPTSALVVTGGEYCFISGLVSESLFNTYLNVVAKKPDYKIVIHNFSGINIQDKNTIERVLYKNSLSKEVTIEIPTNNIISNSKIALINQSNINSCLWGKRIMSFFGNFDNLEKNNINICLIYAERIIAEAYSKIGRTCIETGVVINPCYRNLGLASYISAELIYRIKNKYKHIVDIYWTCDKINIGSQKTAEKLGYIKTNNYLFYTKT